jgi:hypothetical protein
MCVKRRTESDDSRIRGEPVASWPLFRGGEQLSDEERIALGDGKQPIDIRHQVRSGSFEPADQCLTPQRRSRSPLGSLAKHLTGYDSRDEPLLLGTRRTPRRGPA